MEETSKTCTGCVEEHLNQSAHMGPGGCLYETDDMLYSLSEDDITPFPTLDITDTSRPLYSEAAPCTVCVFQEITSELPDSVCRALPGIMRCNDHRTQCAICLKQVRHDAFLMCTECWEKDEITRLCRPSKVKIETIENRLCLYTTRKRTEEECWACGCISCKRRTNVWCEPILDKSGKLDISGCIRTN